MNWSLRRRREIKRGRKKKTVEVIMAEFFLNLMKNIFTYPRSSNISKINTRKTP